MDFDIALIPPEFWYILIIYYVLVIMLLKHRHDGNKDLCIVFKIGLGIIFVATPLVLTNLNSTSVIIIEAGLIMTAICDTLLGVEKYTEKKEFTIMSLITATLCQLLFFSAAITFDFNIVFFLISIILSGLFFLWPKKIFKEHWLVWFYQTFFLASVVYSFFIYITCGVPGIGILMIGQLLYLISDMILMVMRFWHYYFIWDVISKIIYYTSVMIICCAVIFW